MDHSHPTLHNKCGQSWACNNTVVTTRPCFQATKLFVIAILLYLVQLLHLQTSRSKYFSNFFWSLRLCYVVALLLSRSYKIVACPALNVGTISTNKVVSWSTHAPCLQILHAIFCGIFSAKVETDFRFQSAFEMDDICLSYIFTLLYNIRWSVEKYCSYSIV